MNRFAMNLDLSCAPSVASHPSSIHAHVPIVIPSSGVSTVFSVRKTRDEHRIKGSPLDRSASSSWLTNARKYVGAVTRFIISLCFIGGAVALLVAMRSRDLPLLRACFAGFAVFAVTQLMMIVVSVSVLYHSSAYQIAFGSFETWFLLLFAIVMATAFVWFAAVIFVLWRESVRELRASA